MRHLHTYKYNNNNNEQRILSKIFNLTAVVKMMGLGGSVPLAPFEPPAIV